MNESDILKIEEDQLNREITELFHVEVPFVLNSASSLMNISKGLFVNKKDSGRDSSTKGSGKFELPLQIVGGALKGHIDILGSKIVYGDITITLNKWNKGASYSTRLSNSSPWVLSQIENAARFLSLGIQELNELKFILEEDAMKNSITLLRNALGRLLVNLSRAKNEIILHPSGLFPNSQSHLAKTFHPELPNELVLEFHIHKGKLLASVYALGSSTSTSSPSADSFIGHNVKYNGSLIQVHDFWEGEYNVPNYLTALKNIDECVILCTDLRDKADALLSLSGNNVNVYE